MRHIVESVFLDFICVSLYNGRLREEVISVKNAKEFAREHSYKIPMLDASVIWRLNTSSSGLKLYERAKSSKGNEKYKPNTALFSGALKYCLETEKLESVYKETFRVKSFCSVHNQRFF